LLEARDRLGGRIHAHRVKSNGQDVHYDLGPAWFWLGQPRIAALIDELGLNKFDQYAIGELIFEDATGPAQRGRGFASMQGSHRLAGGLTNLINALSAQIPPECVSLGLRATSLHYENMVTTSVQTRDETIKEVRSRTAVLAIPPRVAAQTIDYTPALSPSQNQALLNGWQDKPRSSLYMNAHFGEI